MASFYYEATNKRGEYVRGRIEVTDKNEVIAHLEKKELIPLSILEEGEEKQKGKIVSLKTDLFETVKPMDIILLIRNLSATLKAGLNIIEALEVLIRDTTKKTLKKILTQTKMNLQNGQPLSVSFSQYPRHFSPVFTGLVRAGEVSGHLDETLDELSQQLSKEHALSRQVRSALAYPTILLIGSIGVVVLLLVFILPRIAKSFLSSKMDLPLVTKIVIGASNAIVNNPIGIIAILAFFIWLFVYFKKTPRGRIFFQKIFLKTPIIKNVSKKVVVVRFTRTLASLLSSGIPVVEALDLVSKAVNNKLYENAIQQSLEQIKNGVPISKALNEFPDLFPPLLISMVGVGERTGTLEHVLKTFAGFYEEEINYALKDVTTLIEPILLLVMGLIVGTIAISILLPIYRLVGNFV
jgi:type II secretory pathway component PulF